MKKLLMFTALAFPLFLNCSIAPASQINQDHKMEMDEEMIKSPRNIIPEENKVEEEVENIFIYQEDPKKQAMKSASRRVNERLGLKKREKETFKK